jgi:hypothetical protein
MSNDRPSRARTFWRLAPWLSRLPLVVAAPFFVFLGTRWLFQPAALVSRFGGHVDEAAGLTNLRGNGAVFIALFVVVAVCAASTRRVLAGLWLLTAIVAVAFAVRCSILIFDGATPMLLGIMRAESGLLGFTAAGLCLEIVRRRREARAA